MSNRLVRVHSSAEEALPGEGERVFAVVRGGIQYFAVAKAAKEARADVSVYLGDTVAPVGGAKAGPSSIAKQIAKLSPEEIVRLKELIA